MQSKVGPILIGLAYLGLLLFIIVFTAQQTSTFDEYSKYWGLFGTLIGVATGAIPGFFFKNQADQRAANAENEAKNATRRAEAYAVAASPDKAQEVLEKLQQHPPPGH